MEEPRTQARMVDGERRAPMPALLILTAFCSVGTGVLWNGIAFIAEHAYAFPKMRNLTLALFMAVLYVAGAFGSGRVIRLLERHLSARAVLGCILGLLTLVCLSLLVVSAEWMLWIVAAATSVLAATLWPIVESYMTAGRHGREMRAAIGWWNVVWTLMVGVGMLGMALFMSGDPATARKSIVALGALYAIAAIALRWFPARPAAHDDELSREHVGEEYRHLLHAARFLLPLSYLLVGTLSPLMPYLLDDLRVADGWKAPVTATWMFARVGAIALMWQLPGWHGRWGTLLAAGVGLVVGFAGVVAAPSVGAMIVALIVFGAAQGATYYAAIYYAMSFGKAEVHAGGVHEGLIGVGYAAGPLAGIVGVAVARDVEQFSEVETLIGVALVTVVLVSPLMIRPYMRARALRSPLPRRSKSRLGDEG